MSENKSDKFLGDCSMMFLKAEYIKRHFESYNSDAEWLFNNWNLPLKKYEIEFSKYSLGQEIDILNDFIHFYHAKNNNFFYESILTPLFKSFFELIIDEYEEWIKKIYHISIENGLSFAELAHPISIKSIFSFQSELDDIKFFPPAFVTPYNIDTSTIAMQGKTDEILHLTIDVNKCFDIDKLLNSIRNRLSLHIAKVNPDFYSKSLNKCLKNIEKKDNISKLYKNSFYKELIGLEQWDFYVKNKTYQGFKNELSSLRWPYCSGNKCSNCESDACKKAILRQRKTTERSIYTGDIETHKYNINNKDIIDKIKINPIFPRIHLKELTDEMVWVKSLGFELEPL